MVRELREKMRDTENSCGMRRNDTVLSRVLTTLLIILNLPNFPISPITSQPLPQHPMSRRYSCIIVNIEIFSYELFFIIDDFTYSTLCDVLREFCFCHLDMCLKCDVNFDIFVFKFLYNYNRRKNPTLYILYKQYEVFSALYWV